MKFLGIPFINYTLSILLTSAVFCQFTLAVGGSSGGGGGSVIQFDIQKEPILLDLLMYHPELRKSKIIKSHNNFNIQKNNYLEIESLYKSDEFAFRLARKKLDLWAQTLNGKCKIIQEPLMFELINLVRESINNMFYLRTSKHLIPNDKVFLPENLKLLNPIITTVIHYDRHFGVLISSPIWDTLSTETQAGLIIHEGMRNIQLHYIAQLSEQQIQKITAIILDTSLISVYELNFKDLLGPILIGILGGISKKNVRCNDSIYKILDNLINDFHLINDISTLLFPVFDIGQKKTGTQLLNYLNESNSNKEEFIKTLFYNGILE